MSAQKPNCCNGRKSQECTQNKDGTIIRALRHKWNKHRQSKSRKFSGHASKAGQGTYGLTTEKITWQSLHIADGGLKPEQDNEHER